jgi:hypothetical protein
MTYLQALAIAFDQLINALLNGSPDETLSSRAWRMHLKRQPYWWWLASAINGIFFWQANHCRGAYARELARGHLPEGFLINATPPPDA